MNVEIHYDRGSQFGIEIHRIAKAQNWTPQLTIHLLTAHALGIYHEYDRADMELIIKGVAIE